MTAAAVGIGLPHWAVSSGLSESSSEVCILDHPGGARHGVVTHDTPLWECLQNKYMSLYICTDMDG